MAMATVKSRLPVRMDTKRISRSEQDLAFSRAEGSVCSVSTVLQETLAKLDSYDGRTDPPEGRESDTPISPLTTRSSNGFFAKDGTRGGEHREWSCDASPADATALEGVGVGKVIWEPWVRSSISPAQSSGSRIPVACGSPRASMKIVDGDKLKLEIPGVEDRKVLSAEKCEVSPKESRFSTASITATISRAKSIAQLPSSRLSSSADGEEIAPAFVPRLQNALPPRAASIARIPCRKASAASASSDGKVYPEVRQDSMADGTGNRPVSPTDVSQPPIREMIRPDHDPDNRFINPFEEVNRAESIEAVDWQARHSQSAPAGEIPGRPGRALSGVELRALSKHAVLTKERRESRSERKKRKLTSTPEQIEQLRKLWSAERERREASSVGQKLKSAIGSVKHLPGRLFAPRARNDSRTNGEKSLTGVFQNRQVLADREHDHKIQFADSLDTIASRSGADVRRASASHGPFELAAGDDPGSQRTSGRAQGQPARASTTRVPMGASSSVRLPSPILLVEGQVRPFADVSMSEVQQLWLRTQADARADQLEGWSPLY